MQTLKTKRQRRDVIEPILNERFCQGLNISKSGFWQAVHTRIKKSMKQINSVISTFQRDKNEIIFHFICLLWLWTPSGCAPLGGKVLTRSLPRQFAQYLKTIQHEGFALFVVRMSLPLHLYTCRQFVAEKSNIATAQFLPMLESREDSLLYSGPLRKKVPLFCAIPIGNVRIFINKTDIRSNWGTILSCIWR